MQTAVVSGLPFLHPFTSTQSLAQVLAVSLVGHNLNTHQSPLSLSLMFSCETVHLPRYPKWLLAVSHSTTILGRDRARNARPCSPTAQPATWLNAWCAPRITIYIEIFTITKRGLSDRNSASSMYALGILARIHQLINVIQSVRDWQISAYCAQLWGQIKSANSVLPIFINLQIDNHVEY